MHQTLFALSGRQLQSRLLIRTNLEPVVNRSYVLDYSLGEDFHLTQWWQKPLTMMSLLKIPGKLDKTLMKILKHPWFLPEHTNLRNTLARSSFGLKVLYTQRLKHKCLNRALLSASGPTV